VVAGRDDTLVSPRRVEELARLLPAAELAVMDRVGHFPMHEREDELAALMTAFLARVP
jgi:pimeloyl-ACP methyl ester carboxylesterase